MAIAPLYGGVCDLAPSTGHSKDSFDLAEEREREKERGREGEGERNASLSQAINRGGWIKYNLLETKFDHTKDERYHG